MKSHVFTRMSRPSTRGNRSKLVQKIKRRGIRNLDVLSALDCVPRHRFIDRNLISRAYDDIPLPIGYHQTISQPFVVALMSEKLIDGSANRELVFEIGTGCGYQTAVLAQLYEWVCSIERIQPLYKCAKDVLASLQIDNVELRYGDGHDGWDSGNTFDSIILTAAPKRIPMKILSQLSPGGCLVAPVGNSMDQRLRVINNEHGYFNDVQAEAVQFVPLIRGIEK